MKIQIDTKAKTIKVEETVKFDELIKVLNKLLPKEWKSYSLETGSVIQWYNPIIWHYSTYPTVSPLPIYDVAVGDGFNTGTVNVYNVEAIVN